MQIEGKLSFAGNRIIIVKKDNSHVVLDDIVARDLSGKHVRVTLEVLEEPAPPPPQPIVMQAAVTHHPTPPTPPTTTPESSGVTVPLKTNTSADHSPATPEPKS